MDVLIGCPMDGLVTALVRIRQQPHPRDTRKGLSQELEPLAPQLQRHRAHAGQVSSWPSQARDDSLPDGVGYQGEDDRDRARAGRFLHGHGTGPRGHADHVDLKFDQLARERQPARLVAVDRAVHEDDVVAFGPTPPLQFGPKRCP
jgi:hypothetical protein